MSRFIALLLVLAASATTTATAAQALRGPDGAPVGQVLLTWPGKEAQLRGRQAQAAPRPQTFAPHMVQPPPQAPPPLPRPQLLSDAYGGPPAPQVQTFQAASRQAPQSGPGPLTPRRYSVGREFGVEPDPIALPGPTVLAFAPEVGAAFAAQNLRKDEETTPSPADLDQIQQANDDDARREARQKARDKAQAANN